MCALATPDVAQDLPRGQILDRVVVRGEDAQSYSLYIPSTYSPERSWPILYCLDPGARGRIPVEVFSQAAEKAGFLVAGSNNSQNGPSGPIQDALRWMWGDTHARWKIDDSRVYAAGFSGGARIALAWAGNGTIAGVVASGAGFSQTPIPKNLPFKIFATAGVDDFNYDELYRMSLELAGRGVPHRFVEFEGGHQWLTPNLASDALDYFLGRLGPLAAQPSKAQEKSAEKYARLAAAAREAGGRSTILQLQKDAANPSDRSDRRIARRVIFGTYVYAMEASREAMSNRQYAEAARLREIAVLAQPENGAAWYALAVAQAASGNKRRALEALEQAAANGFRDAERMEGEPLLAPARTDPRYQAVLRTLRLHN